jgi:hypothetical protein
METKPSTENRPAARSVERRLAELPKLSAPITDSAADARTMPSVLAPLPRRQKDLNERLDPPMAHVTADAPLPRRAAHRIDIEEPMSTLRITDNCSALPTAANPATESELPHCAVHLTDSELPACSQSYMLKRLPIRTCVPLRLKLEPKFIASPTETVVANAIVFELPMLTPEDNRAKWRILTLDANMAKPVTDAHLPADRENPRTERVLPRSRVSVTEHAILQTNV